MVTRRRCPVVALRDRPGSTIGHSLTRRPWISLLLALSVMVLGQVADQVSGVATTSPDATGYWMLASDFTVYNFWERSQRISPTSPIQWSRRSTRGAYRGDGRRQRLSRC